MRRRLLANRTVRLHHEKLRFTWRMLFADGKVYVEGIDFGELSTDGKLDRIVGFFGPLAPKPQTGGPPVQLSGPTFGRPLMS